MNLKLITKFYLRHLSDTLLLIGILFGGTIIFSCSDQVEIPEKYIAKVDDEYLTEEEVNTYLNDNEIDSTRADEYIRTWVRNKVLIKSAVVSKFDKSSEFLALSKEATQSILVNLFVEHLLKEKLEVVSDNDLLNYFTKNEQRFTLGNDFFILNILRFEKESDAEKFSMLTGNTINEKLDQMSLSADSYELSLNNRFYEFELPSSTLFESVKYVEAGEYSSIFKTELNKFEIVQVVNKLYKGDVPDYKLISDFVREVYIAEQKQLLLGELIDDLYDDFEIEIKKEYN